MNPKTSMKQRVDQTLKEYEANDAYLTEQSIKTLRLIKNSMEFEASQQPDAAKKKKMEIIASQAQDEINFRTTKGGQKLKNLNVVSQIQRARRLISAEAGVSVIVNVLLALLLYFQSNQRND